MRISDKAKEILYEFHHHAIDSEDEEGTVKKIFNTIKTRYGKIDSTIHFTGSFDYNKDLTSLIINNGIIMVNKFVNIPHLITIRISSINGYKRSFILTPAYL